MTDPRSALRSSACDVLILEDEAFVRAVTAALLDEAGFSVSEAASSTEALALLQATPCRVLLVDLMLGPDSPIQDGRDVAAEAMRLHPGPAVIYTSGLQVDLGRPLTPRERILLKPYSLHRLIGLVRELLAEESVEACAV